VVVEEPKRNFIITRKNEEEVEQQINENIATHLKSIALQKEQ